jgi:hypothetical protein
MTLSRENIHSSSDHWSGGFFICKHCPNLCQQLVLHFFFLSRLVCLFLSVIFTLSTQNGHTFRVDAVVTCGGPYPSSQTLSHIKLILCCLSSASVSPCPVHPIKLLSSGLFFQEQFDIVPSNPFRGFQVIQVFLWEVPVPIIPQSHKTHSILNCFQFRMIQQDIIQRPPSSFSNRMLVNLDAGKCFLPCITNYPHDVLLDDGEF